MLIKLICEMQDMNELRNMTEGQLINLNESVCKELYKRKKLDDEFILKDVIYKYGFNVSDSFLRFILFFILALHILYKNKSNI